LKTLLLGWGNPDRQDDGAAWHVLAEVARRSGLSLPVELGEAFDPTGGDLEFYFSLQLTPELSELVSSFERVVFIDAHTGAVPDDLNIRLLSPGFQTSPLTHHLTAESCLELASQLYGSRPEAWLVSVRGFAFGFSRDLSEPTAELVQRAASHLILWLAGGSVL
jgi:Ni,Fe-hydrogenase maturation factor